MLAGSGAQSGFFATFAVDGTPQVSKALVASDHVEVTDARSDASGNVYVAGSFTGSLNFAGMLYESTGTEDLLVAKYDATGNESWAYTFGGSGLTRGYSLGLRPSGDLVVLARAVGGVVDYADAGATVAEEDEVTSLLLVGLSALGEAQEITTLSDTAIARGSSLGVSATGNLLVSGSYSGNVDWGGGPVMGDFAAFLASYGADGSYQWSQTATQGAGARTTVNALSQNATGRVLVTGSVHESATFGGASLLPAGAGDVLVAALEGAGTPAFTVSFGAMDNETGRDVVADALGGGIVSGSYRGAPMLGTSALPMAQTTNALVLKVDALGALVWARGFATNSAESGVAVHLTPEGHVITAGAFEGQANFDGNVLQSRGASDIYIAELLP
jgi:hypothetical protein